MSNRLPFHVYSSYNKHGGRRSPIVTRRMNKILDMWADFATQDEIAEALGVLPSTVVRYIQRAKRRNDPRALRLFDRRSLRRHMLDKHVQRLADAGMSKLDIAKGLGVSHRCVQIRLRGREDMDDRRKGKSGPLKRMSK